jgi:anti-anti-sigma factor
MALQIGSLEKKPGFFELSLAGRLDSVTYADLEKRIDLLMTVPVQAIVLDLGLLEYISSMGLRVILKTRKDLKAKNGVLMVTNMQPQIKKVFAIANAIPDDAIFASVDEADRYYAAIQDKVKRGEA